MNKNQYIIIGIILVGIAFFIFKNKNKKNFNKIHIDNNQNYKITNEEMIEEEKEAKTYYDKFKDDKGFIYIP